MPPPTQPPHMFDIPIAGPLLSHHGCRGGQRLSNARDTYTGTSQGSGESPIDQPLSTITKSTGTKSVSGVAGLCTHGRAVPASDPAPDDPRYPRKHPGAGLANDDLFLRDNQ